MSLTAVIRSVQKWAHFAFDIPLGYPFTEEQQFRRETGLGISAPNAYRFVDVIRHDSTMVVGLFSVITVLSRALYLIISPQNIWDIPYVLAVLYMIYSIIVIILIYLAIRDLEHPTRIDMHVMERDPPFQHCPICFLDTPSMDFISLHCYPPEDEALNPDRALHTFHEDCLMLIYNDERSRGVRQHICPACRRIPLAYERHHGPRLHGILDNSRLVWYLYSFFARRFHIRPRIFRDRRPRPNRLDRRLSISHHWIRILTEGLLLHMLLITALLISIHFTYLTLSLPLSWPAWIMVTRYPIAFFFTVPIRLVSKHSQLMQMRRPLTLLQIMNDLSTTFGYFFPRLSGADPANFDFPLRDLIRIQFPRLLRYLWALFWYILVKTLYETIIVGLLMNSIVVASILLYHTVIIALYGPL